MICSDQTEPMDVFDMPSASEHVTASVSSSAGNKTADFEMTDRHTESQTEQNLSLVSEFPGHSDLSGLSGLESFSPQQTSPLGEGHQQRHGQGCNAANDGYDGPYVVMEDAAIGHPLILTDPVGSEHSGGLDVDDMDQDVVGKQDDKDPDTQQGTTTERHQGHNEDDGKAGPDTSMQRQDYDHDCDGGENLEEENHALTCTHTKNQVRHVMSMNEGRLTEGDDGIVSNGSPMKLSAMNSERLELATPTSTTTPTTSNTTESSPSVPRASTIAVATSSSPEEEEEAHPSVPRVVDLNKQLLATPFWAAGAHHFLQRKGRPWVTQLVKEISARHARRSDGDGGGNSSSDSRNDFSPLQEMVLERLAYELVSPSTPCSSASLSSPSSGSTACPRLGKYLDLLCLCVGSGSPEFFYPLTFYFSDENLPLHGADLAAVLRTVFPELCNDGYKDEKKDERSADVSEKKHQLDAFVANFVELQGKLIAGGEQPPCRMASLPILSRQKLRDCFSAWDSDGDADDENHKLWTVVLPAIFVKEMGWSTEGLVRGYWARKENKVRFLGSFFFFFFFFFSSFFLLLSTLQAQQAKDHFPK